MADEKEQAAAHISIDAEGNDGLGSPKSERPRSISGWDGKLRVDKKLELANPEALSDPEYSDEDNVVPGELIEADEGKNAHFYCAVRGRVVCISLTTYLGNRPAR